MQNSRIYVVAGNSPDTTKYWHRIFKDIKAFGLKAYCVNPALKESQGDILYPDLQSLPEKGTDLILVARPDVSAALVDKAIELGYKEIWFQPGTFSQEAEKRALDAGLQTHNYCFMTSNGIW